MANETINKLYQQILGRTPDTGGAEFWANYIASRGTPNLDPEELQAFIAAAQQAGEPVNMSAANQFFSQQQMNPQVPAAIQNLYEEILDRPADQGGAEFWTNYTATNGTPGVDPEEVQAFVAAAQQAGEQVNTNAAQNVIQTLPTQNTQATQQTNQPKGTGTTTGSFTEQDVRNLYQQYFNRAPDQAGLDFWMNSFKGGPTPGIDPQEISAFLGGATGQDRPGATAALPTTGESRIDPTIAPYLTEALGRARQLFLGEQAPQLYPGQMYVSPSQQTMSALAQQEAIASQYNPALAGAQNVFLQGLNAPAFGSGQFQNLYQMGGMQPGVSAYEQAMSGAFTPQTQPLQQVAQGFGDVAGGSFLTGSPYQQRLIEQSTRPITEQFLEQTLPALQSQFSRAGRYGSGAQERAIGKATEAAARAVGDIATQIGQQTYTQERGFQEAARGAQANVLGQIAGLQQTGFGNILAGAQGLQGAQAQQFGQQMNAAQALANAQQQSLATQLGTAAQAPQFYAQQFLPSQALAQVGAQREAIAGQPLQEAITRWNYQQQLPYQQLGGYLSSIYGSPLGGLTAAPQQQGNAFLGNLGSVLNIAGTAANLFPQTTSNVTNWVGSLLGGK
jgi:hypothetical protein